MKLIATYGLPGSGKSTWATEQILADPGNVARVNKDFLRHMLHANKWSKDAEEFTRLVHSAALAELMKKKMPVIICDDTNLAPQNLEFLRSLAEIAGYEFEVEDFTHVPLNVCIDRDADREGKARVGSEVILRMYNRYLVDKSK